MHTSQYEPLQPPRIDVEINIKVNLSWVEALAVSCAIDPHVTAPDAVAIENLLRNTANTAIEKAVIDYQNADIVEVPVMIPVSLWARHIHAQACDEKRYFDDPYPSPPLAVAKELQEMVLAYLEDYDEIIGVEHPLRAERQRIFQFTFDEPRRRGRPRKASVT